MAVCSSCGTDNPDGQKFCGECAAPLGAAPRRVEERKVITALFCDLVGFTAISESADAEDVDRMLAEYFTMARAQIEAFGGIVEKFIGDAVVGGVRRAGRPRGRPGARRARGPADRQAWFESSIDQRQAR